jgi:lipoprotein NlpI
MLKNTLTMDGPVSVKLLDSEYGGRTLNRNVGIYLSINHIITQDLGPFYRSCDKDKYRNRTCYLRGAQN